MDIKEAFELDGFTVVAEHTINGYTGYVAESKTAINHLNGKPKKAYYIEGGPTEMGTQMGFLAADEVIQMVKEFPQAAIGGLLGTGLTPDERKLMTDIILFIIRGSIYMSKDDIPYEYIVEAQGIISGVKKANFSAGLTFEELWTLNVGIDIIIANLSDPIGFLEKIANTSMAKEKNFKPAKDALQYCHSCNAFSAFGGAVADGKSHFFGRDWMFNGADVLENCAALIICKPNDKRKPLVYAAAPGFVGAALAMNNDGIAMGVNMATAANGDRNKPGFNSILLVRHAIHMSESATDAVNLIQQVQRGAPYIYPISDGKNNKACVIEAGMKTGNLNPLSYPPDALKQYLPDQKFLDENSEKPTEGMVTRWNDYQQPQVFMEKFNKGLFEYYKKTYKPDVWGKSGFVFSKPYKDDDAFGFEYFTPQREENENFILATNLWLAPQMNLCYMSDFTRFLSEAFWPDPQWRYDLLNETILSNYGKMDWDSAWKTINMLSPVIGTEKGKGYYLIPDAQWKLPTVTYKDSEGNTKTTWRVDGMTNLCELSETKKVRSLYGTYADEFVEITLPNYL